MTTAIIAELFGRDQIQITSSYMDRELTKQIPGGMYDRTTKTWYAPVSYATCVTMRAVFGDRLKVGDELNAWSWSEYNHRIEPCTRLRAALTLDGVDLTDEQAHVMAALDRIEAADPSGRALFPYQRVDLLVMVTAGCHILGNEPGLGKTGVAIRTMQVMQKLGKDPFPALIVCPNSLKHTVWAQEFALWAPELSVQVVDGSAAKRRKQLASGAQVFILNYEGVRQHSNLSPYGSHAMTEAEKTPKELNSMGLRTVIFDEAHRVRNIKSAVKRTRLLDGEQVTTVATGAQATRAAWAVAHGAVYRYAMTGTPVANHVGDVWTLMHLVEPTWAQGRSKFLDLYAKTLFNSWGGMEVLGINPEHRDALDRIIQPLLRRVPKSLALPQLPERLPTQYRHTPMTPAQAKAYKEMEAHLIAELADDTLMFAKKGSHLAKLTRLNQFAATAMRTVDGVVDENGNPTFTMIDPSGKIDDLIDVLEEMGEAPLVVAAVSRQLIELTAKRLDSLNISNVSITGAVDVLDRQEAVRRFQEGDVRVILLTLGAGAEGITLTRADTMLFMQESYSTVQNAQARDRIYRIGSEGHQSIRIIVQITPDTVEERRVELLAEKDRKIEEIIQDAATLATLLGA